MLNDNHLFVLKEISPKNKKDLTVHVFKFGNGRANN